jgi:hypothetical protein
MAKRLNPRRRQQAKARAAERASIIEANKAHLPELRAEQRGARGQRQAFNHDKAMLRAVSGVTRDLTANWETKGVAGRNVKGKVVRAKYDRTDEASARGLSQLARELRAAEAAGMSDLRIECPHCKAKAMQPQAQRSVIPTEGVDEKGRNRVIVRTFWTCETCNREL